MNVLQYVLQQMQEELASHQNGHADNHSRLFREVYARASSRQRAAINEALICLCGWSAPILLERTGAEAVPDAAEEYATLAASLSSARPKLEGFALYQWRADCRAVAHAMASSDRLFQRVRFLEACGDTKAAQS